MNGILVANSRFRNTALTQFAINQRGIGINSTMLHSAASAIPTTPTTAWRLYAGVVASVPDPAEVYEVDGMAFFNNSHGVVDPGSTGGVVTNNAFTTMANATPLSDPSVGLTLYNAEGYTVGATPSQIGAEACPSVGVYFMGNSLQDNQIRNNTFTDTHFGCVVQGRHAEGSVPSTVPACGCVVATIPGTFMID
ncbi:MAG: hypothetical protein IPL52_11290 [Flavobacteriales bacterium]|nr:hypothetical protein [Flavobacteriales bacterium]